MVAHKRPPGSTPGAGFGAHLGGARPSVLSELAGFAARRLPGLSGGPADLSPWYRRSMTVAALYIDSRGPYPAMPDVDCWDAERDARKYAGPHPVVAHPPCGPWGQLAHLCTKQDPALAPLAVEQVRRWGGVLEHPSHSRLWRALELPRPGELPIGNLWSLEVEQVRWGHPARKRTWLLFCRVPRSAPGELPPPREPTHWCSALGKDRWKAAQGRGIKVASAQIRRRTPPAFARWLVDLAALARPA